MERVEHGRAGPGAVPGLQLKARQAHARHGVAGLERHRALERRDRGLVLLQPLLGAAELEHRVLVRRLELHGLAQLLGGLGVAPELAVQLAELKAVQRILGLEVHGLAEQLERPGDVPARLADGAQVHLGVGAARVELGRLAERAFGGGRVALPRVRDAEEQVGLRARRVEADRGLVGGDGLLDLAVPVLRDAEQHVADGVLRVGGDGAAHLLQGEVVLLVLDVAVPLAHAAHGLRRHDLVPDRLLPRLRLLGAGARRKDGDGKEEPRRHKDTKNG